MKRIVLGLGLATMVALMPAPAFAKRGIGLGGSGEQLLFVTDTSVKAVGNSPVALCIKAQRVHVFWLNLFRYPDKYVLAPERCQGDGYYDISDDRLAEAWRAGQIPQEVPRSPSFTLGQQFMSYIGSILFGLLFLFGLAAKRINAAPASQSIPVPVRPAAAMPSAPVESRTIPVQPMAPQASAPMPAAAFRAPSPEMGYAAAPAMRSATHHPLPGGPFGKRRSV